MPSTCRSRKANRDSAKADELRVKQNEYRKNREAEGRPISWNTQRLMDFATAAVARGQKEAMEELLKAAKPKPKPAKTRE
jgi:hypothetical protein